MSFKEVLKNSFEFFSTSFFMFLLSVSGAAVHVVLRLSFLFIDSLSMNLSQRYSTDGRTIVIMTTEQTVPMPISRPTVEIEFWLEMKCMTKPHTVRISPEVNTVGIAATTERDSACFLSYSLRYAT